MPRPASIATLVLLACAGATSLSAAEADALFVHRVLPLLQQKCFSCHGAEPDKVKSESC